MRRWRTLATIASLSTPPPRRHNRANWVGLRTLRQIPKVVGQTDAGETIYEVRSARLVLHGDAAHFNRLVRCSRCGREVPGRVVLGPGDLDHAPQAVVCDACVELTTAPAARAEPPAFADVEGLAEPVVVDEPALVDADAEMHLAVEGLVEEQGMPTEDEEITEDAGAGDPAADEVEPEEQVSPTLELAEEEAELDESAVETPTALDVEVESLLAEADPADESAELPVEDEGAAEEPPAPTPLPLVAVTYLDDEPTAPPTPIEDTIRRLEEQVAAQAERQAALDARLEQLAGKKDTDKLRRRLDQLQGTIDAEWARSKSETATLSQALNDLGERVLLLAEEAGDAAGADDERLTAVVARVGEVANGLARAMESQRQELDDRLREGLADILSAVPPAPAATTEDHDSRFRALERQIQQSRAEVGELNELHAALDAGLGALRAELGEVRTAYSRLADSKADLDDRLETFVRMSLVPDAEKGRKAKKAAESTLGTLSAAVQDLLREQRQLKDTVASLEQVSDGATAAAARASMQASSVGPLRSDVKVLHQELVAQQDALEELHRAVDRLRQAPPAPVAPPAPRPPATTAKPPAAKAATAATKAASARSATAKAAIARAAAAQAAADKAAPAAKRGPAAKKRPG